MTKRQPDADNDLIDRLTENPTPGQSGSEGGNLARDVGKRADLESAVEGDSGITRVRKGDKADDGDEPTLPNRNGTSDE